MDEENMNWFRFTRLIKDVGTDILRKHVVEYAQTPFVNDLEYVWLAKAQQMKDINFVVYHWVHFVQDLKTTDETCRRRLQPLLKSWRLPESQKLTFSEQVHTLEKWKNDIEKCISSNPSNAKDTLSSWIEQIQDRIENINSVSTILEKWTTCYLELCQRSRQDLLRNIETHYDTFLVSSRDEVTKWGSMSRENLKARIANLESNRKKLQETWKKVSEMYFRSVRQKIKDLLTSWKEYFHGITNIEEFRNILDDLESDINEIDETQGQKSCDTWHQKMHNLFDKWLKKLDERDDIELRFDSDFQSDSFSCILYEDELLQCPSIRSQHVKDAFVSETTNKMLQKLKQKKQLSEEQYSNLCPSSDFPDLQEFDQTLLFIVLSNCLVYPPMHGWNEAPPELDLSLGADILRLKSFRNDIILHIEVVRIGQTKFDRLWFNAKDVLCRLASGSGQSYKNQVSTEIDRIKTCSYNPERETELQQTLIWCKKDILAELKGMVVSYKSLNMLEMIERVHRKISICKKVDDLYYTREGFEMSEWQRLSSKEKLSEGNSVDTQTENTDSSDEADEVTTLWQGLRYGWTEVRKYGGGVAAASIWAIIGGTYGIIHGIYRIFIYK